MSSQPQNEVVRGAGGFNYRLVKPDVADKARAIAARIQARLRRTLHDITDIGNDLLEAKRELKRPRFGLWLRAEFGWSPRVANHYMAVAKHFGQTANFANSQIPDQRSRTNHQATAPT